MMICSVLCAATVPAAPAHAAPKLTQLAESPRAWLHRELLSADEASRIVKFVGEANLNWTASPMGRDDSFLPVATPDVLALRERLASAFNIRVPLSHLPLTRLHAGTAVLPHNDTTAESTPGMTVVAYLSTPQEGGGDTRFASGLRVPAVAGSALGFLNVDDDGKVDPAAQHSVGRTADTDAPRLAVVLPVNFPAGTREARRLLFSTGDARQGSISLGASGSAGQEAMQFATSGEGLGALMFTQRRVGVGENRVMLIQIT